MVTTLRLIMNTQTWLVLRMGPVPVTAQIITFWHASLSMWGWSPHCPASAGYFLMRLRPIVSRGDQAPGSGQHGGYCCPGWWDAGAILMKRWPWRRVAGSYPGSAPWCCQRSPGVNIPTLELTRASAAGETRPPAQVLTLWWSVLSCEGAFCLDWHTDTLWHRRSEQLEHRGHRAPTSCWCPQPRVQQNSLELPGQRSDLGSGAQTRHLSLSLSLINCFHRIAGAGTDIAELVAGARRGVGASPPDCLALLTSYVTDVFWVEILSRADLVMQLLQPLSQSLTGQSKQEQEW